MVHGVHCCINSNTFTSRSTCLSLRASFYVIVRQLYEDKVLDWCLVWVHVVPGKLFFCLVLWRIIFEKTFGKVGEKC